MSLGFRRGLRSFGIAAALGSAVAAGWLGSAAWRQQSSLTMEPASAPASLEWARAQRARPIEAETADASVQSAWNEGLNPIRTDGPAAAAMGGAADGYTDELLDLVTSESRLVTARMAQEIDGLRRDLDERAVRIRKLSEALAEAQAALDLNESRRAQAVGEAPDRPLEAPIEARIVDANPDLGLVVLDQGARQGMRYGLPLTVVRDRRRVARIRVVDVRERVAGAAVEETARGETPQPGDRAVLIRPNDP